MRFRFLVPLALLLGVLCTVASTFVVRPTNERVITGLGCARTELNPSGLCIVQRPRGGFPLIQVIDAPSGANRGRLGFEDEIHFVSIAGNLAGYTALWLALIGGFSLLRPRAPVEPSAPEAPAATPEGSPPENAESP